MTRRISAAALSLILSLVTAACSRFSSSTQIQSAPAPKSSSETGYTIQADSEELATFLKQTNTKARLLNVNAELFEVFTDRPDVLRKAFPNAFIEKNQYLEKLVHANSLGKTTSLDSSENASSCDPSAPKPEVKIGVISPSEILPPYTLELGQDIVLSSNITPATSGGSAGPIKFSWAVEAPRYSGFSGQIQHGEFLKLNPDVVGTYKISLLAQQANGGCELAKLGFIVTANVPYETPTIVRRFTFEQLKDFQHLMSIFAPEAWKLSDGKGVLIGVIDTGINYNHVDLAPNIAINSLEIPNNEKDDDKNGFIDDVWGWDFVYSDTHPYDENGHGTHVAGLIAATTFGVAPNATLLPIKVLNSMGDGDVASIAAAIMYAADRGVKIINASFGSYSQEFQTLKKAIDYCESKGILFIAASGNGDPLSGIGVNVDETPLFPASFLNDNIISVSAVDSLNTLTTYANFGKTAVDIAAPGGTAEEPIRSTTLFNKNSELYSCEVGTSMAAPQVTGAAALYWSLNPKASVAQVKATLLHGGTPVPLLQTNTVSGRVLNLKNSVQ